MKTKSVIAALLCLAPCLSASAEKALYIPTEWKNFNSRDTLLYAENDPQGQYTWSKSRSKESENFICYWDKYYTSEPTKLSPNNFYYVDIDDLLRKAEQFYALNVGRLAFCDEAVSKVRRYKMMILMNHTTTWTAYGGGYDFTIGALWLNPSTCKPVGHTLAHEIGHSFQYMCYSDLGGHAGFHDPIGQGSTFWEQTAQWQAAQAYPDQMYSQSWTIFPHAYNYAMTHEWQRYQSYWWHYYLADKYGDDIVGRIWRHQMPTAADANEVLMSMMGYGARELYKEYFDYAMKMVTFDIDAIRERGRDYIGTYDYNYVPLGGKKYQVAYASCPQSTGFNVIPLNVPKAGTTITTNFVSLKNQSQLAEGDPALYYNEESQFVASGKVRYNSSVGAAVYKTRGFRLGYVALMDDGTRLYSSIDSVYCQGTSALKNISCDTEFTVPEGTRRLWMVVVPAPSQYIQHKWDMDITNDDQWPYTVEFQGTNILGAPDISADRDICDATITYNIDLPKSSGYGSVYVTLEGEAASVVGTALQMQVGEIESHLVNWASAGPADDKMMFYALDKNGDISNLGSTANGHGHWFNASGTRCSYSDSGASIYAEYYPSLLTFSVGQYPSRLSVGRSYRVGQAIKYRKGDKEATVRFLFNIMCKAASATGSCELESAVLHESVAGDLDGDGSLSVADITLLIAVYLGNGEADADKCDIDGDDRLTVSDITSLISLYLADTAVQ